MENGLANLCATGALEIMATEMAVEDVVVDGGSKSSKRASRVTPLDVLTAIDMRTSLADRPERGGRRRVADFGGSFEAKYAKASGPSLFLRPRTIRHRITCKRARRRGKSLGKAKRKRCATTSASW
jgi:hypothetical protein